MFNTPLNEKVDFGLLESGFVFGISFQKVITHNTEADNYKRSLIISCLFFSIIIYGKDATEEDLHT